MVPREGAQRREARRRRTRRDVRKVDTHAAAGQRMGMRLCGARARSVWDGGFQIRKVSFHTIVISNLYISFINYRYEK